MAGRKPRRLSADRRALLERQLRGESLAPAISGGIRLRKGDGPALLSFGQRQLWFLSQLAAESCPYNESVAIHCPPTTDLPALNEAFNEVVRRHEVWRTVFRTQDGEPVQVVLPFRPLDLPLLDLTHLPAADGAAEARKLAEGDLQVPFDLEQGPLCRPVLVRLEDRSYRLHLTLHHAICDGISINQVLIPELQALHDAFAQGLPSPLPALPVQYADFAVWQREQAATARTRSQLAYWRERLAALPELELPTDHPRPAGQSFRRAARPLTVGQAVAEDLWALGRQEGATLFMVLLAAFDVLLHSYTGQEDLVVGAAATSRKRPELEGLLGYFLNPIVVRTDLAGDPTFRQLVRRVRKATLGALAHNEVAFEQVVSELAPQRDGSRNPLFQALLTLEPPRRRLAPGWGVSQISEGIGSANLDIHVALEERPDGLSGRVVYRDDLFELETIERLVRRFQALLEAVADRPDRRLTGLVAEPTATLALGAEERRRLVVDWNQTAVPTPAVGISRRFEQVAATWPDCEALSCSGERLSYSQLDRRADALAHRLRSMGVGREAVVGVCLDRSLQTVVALLGILKAGAAYLPLDPEYPLRRLALMLEETGAPVVVTSPACWPWQGPTSPRVDDCPLPRGVTPLNMVDEGESGAPTSCLEEAPRPADLAYVLYTSGSTGDPKGVMVEHRSVLRLVCPATFADLGPEAVLLHLAPLAFDASTFEIWGALLNGGRLVVAPPGQLSARELGQVVEREGVTTLWLTAGLFNQVVDAGMPGLGGLTQLLTGGDILSPQHCRRAHELLPRMRLVNGYGPTEATTFTCYHPISARDLKGAAVPIGRPIGNTTVYILDKRGEPVPVGVPGELHVGGQGVARGYFGKPELTKEKFVPDPFTPGGRLYRTGDLARYRPTGEIEFLGRGDRQVKIRGFRIELGEVEAALAAHPGVAEAVVEAVDQGTAGSRLVAYVVPRTRAEPAAGDLADFLAGHLPRHMVPEMYVTLDSVPLTANGKVARHALREPRPDRERGAEAPGRRLTAVEEGLAAIWTRVLGIDRVGPDENFFALGGDSLLAVRMVAEVEASLGHRLPLAAVMGEGSTVTGLARLLNGSRASVVADPPLLTPIRGGRSTPPLFVVEPNGRPLLALRHFVPFLDDDQPVAALLPRTRDGRFDREGSIEALSEELLRVLRETQPRGPYRLAGYSLGGILAFHLAARLRDEGEQVDFLGLIDTMTPALTLRHSEPTIRLTTRVRGLLMTSPRRWPAMAWRAARRAAGASGVASVPGALDWVDSFDDEGAIQLIGRYQVPPCDAHITLFASHWQQRWTRSRSLGWGSVHAGLVDVVTVPGNHLSMLQQPIVSELAANLARHLDRVAPVGMTRPRSSRVSLVVPTWDEAENLPHVLSRVPRWIDEVLIVDRDSCDGTVEVARRFWPGVRILRQEGRGKGQALRQGFEAATGDLVIALDADGSTDPAEIPLFVGALFAGADFVKGSRYIQGGGSSDLSSFRSVGNVGLTAVCRVLYRNSFTDLCYGYFGFWRRLLPVLEPTAQGFEVEAQICVRALSRGLNVYEVPSFERVRISGRSNLRALPDGWKVLTTVLGERGRGCMKHAMEPTLCDTARPGSSGRTWPVAPTSASPGLDTSENDGC